MKILSYLIILAFTFCGCSSTYQINSTADVKKMLEMKDGSVYLTNNDKFEALDFQIYNDSLRFTNENTHLPKSIALRDITRIERINRLHRAGLGAVIGASATFIPLTIIAINNPIYNQPDGEAGRPLVYGVIGAATIIGGAIGAIIGESIWTLETYNFLMIH
jgi:hypothetical protein